MREITHSDIRACARVLLARAQGDWSQLLAQMLAEADHADRYRKAFGRAHPRFGNGTLIAVALAHHPAPEPVAADNAYLGAIAAVIEAVLDWRAERQGLAAKDRC